MYSRTGNRASTLGTLFGNPDEQFEHTVTGFSTVFRIQNRFKVAFQAFPGGSGGITGPIKQHLSCVVGLGMVPSCNQRVFPHKKSRPDRQHLIFQPWRLF